MAGQQQPVCGQGIARAEEAEALNQSTDGRVDGDHAFGFELAEWHQDRPLVGSGGVKAIEGEVGRFTDSHSRVTEQQEDIGDKIIAAK